MDLLEHTVAARSADDVECTDAEGFSTLSVAELRTRARHLGLSGISKLRRAELVELLCAPEFPAT